MVLEHEREHDSHMTRKWSGIRSIAAKIGCSSETLRHWVRAVERDSGGRPGLTTDERQRLKTLEGTVKLSRICPFCGRILLDQRLRINDLAVARAARMPPNCLT